MPSPLSSPHFDVSLSIRKPPTPWWRPLLCCWLPILLLLLLGAILGWLFLGLVPGLFERNIVPPAFVRAAECFVVPLSASLHPLPPPCQVAGGAGDGCSCDTVNRLIAKAGDTADAKWQSKLSAQNTALSTVELTYTHPSDTTVTLLGILPTAAHC